MDSGCLATSRRCEFLPRLVAGLAVTRNICLGRLERADVKCYCHKELLCDSSGEYLELYICVLQLSGVVNSVVLNVRRVILGTRKCIRDLIGDFVDCGAYFRRPHNIFGRVRNVEVKPLTFDGISALPGY